MLRLLLSNYTHKIMGESIGNNKYTIKDDGTIVRGRKCPKCGRELISEGDYCEYCGKKIDLSTANNKGSKRKKIFFSSLVIVLLVSVLGRVFVYHEKKEAVRKENEVALLEKLEELARESEEAAAKAKAKEEERLRQEEVKAVKRAELIKRGYVDLGLPSGTLWKKKPEEDSDLSYSQAMKRYGSQMPSREQWLELIRNCKWNWYEYTENIESVGDDGTRHFGFRMVQGYKIYGKNGKYITLPAGDYGIGKREWYYSSSSTDESIWFTYIEPDNYECREWENFFNDEKKKEDWWCWYFSVVLVSKI